MKKLLSVFLICALIACGGGGGGSSDSGGGGSDGAQLSGGCAVGRVTGGSSCSISNGPVALLYLIDSAGDVNAICSGTFLTSTFVLTAAHCFVDSGAVSAQVVTGSTSGFSKRVITHPNYRPTSEISQYDFALVEMQSAQDVATLPLLVSEGNATGQRITIMGFGLDDRGQSAASVPPADALNGSSMIIDEILSGAFAASFDRTHSSICSGDSGGPALRKNPDGVVGIVGVAQAVSVQNVDADGNPICLAGTVDIFTDTQSSIATNFISRYVTGLGLI